MLLSLLITGISYGAIFTASTSGNYSSPATWTGGMAPPSTVVLDQVIIPAGIVVNMDNNLTLNGAIAQLTVTGTLNTANTSSLTLTLGTLAGAGTIQANAVNINTGSTFSFTGSLTATTLNVGTAVSSTADIMITQTLNLTSGALAVAVGGSLDLGANGTIVLSGGTLNTAGGTVGLTNNYNVSYINVSTIAGAELSGSGLQNVTVNINAANTVTLTADLTVGGTLALTSGVLTLAGNDLTINGDIAASGTGTVSAAPTSNISINTSGGTSGTLTFSGAGAAVNNFTVNTGAGNQTHIGGTLIITGTLQLNSGILAFDNASLTISGNVSGAGSFSGNTASNLTVNTVGGLASALNFVNAGQSIHDFNIAVGAGNSVSLGSNLIVNGTLTLTGNLNLNSNILTLGTASILAGTGSLIASTTSDLVINSTGGVTGLSITGTIRNLAINTGVSNATTVNALTVAGLLTLQSGSLILNSNNLTINGNISATGSGTISSTLASDITVETSASPSGSLNFASSANTVGNLIVNVGGNGALSIGSDVNVNDTLRFLAGKINIGANALVLGSAGVISGSGASSYLVTTVGGYLERIVAAASVDSINFPVGTASQFAPANIRLNAGSSSGPVQVGVVSNVLVEGTSGVDLSATQPLVDATWDIHSLISGTLNLNLEVLWSAAMEVNGFNRNAAYVSHYVNGNWDTNGIQAASAEAGSMYSLHRNGLTTLSPFTVFGQNASTPVTEINNDLNFTVFPNPASDNLVIQNTATSTETMYMDIYNYTGQLVNNTYLTGTSTNVSVKDLLSGVYLIKFHNSKMNYTTRFIKI
jgi:hypothetical protein